MKISLGQIKLSEQALVRLSNEALPIQIAFQVSRLIRQLGPELQNLENQRLKLVHKYGQTDTDSGQTTVPPENIPQFTEEMTPLLDTLIQIDFEKIPLSKFPEEVKLSSTDLLALEAFLEYK